MVFITFIKQLFPKQLHNRALEKLFYFDHWAIFFIWLILRTYRFIILNRFYKSIDIIIIEFFANSYFCWSKENHYQFFNIRILRSFRSHKLIKLPYNWQLVCLNKFTNDLFNTNFVFGFIVLTFLSLLWLRHFWLNFYLFLNLYNIILTKTTITTNEVSKIIRYLITRLILFHNLVAL